MREPLSAELRAKSERLREIVCGLRSCAIGYSGGADSALLLKVATEELGERALGVLAKSPSLPAAEAEEACAHAEQMGARLRIIETRETDDPRYLANDGRRCYFCKSELWDQVRLVAREEGLAEVCDGANADDVQDYRPGAQAAAERDVRAPLREAGFTKDDVRRLSSHLGLSTSMKPSSPCLSSRIPHGTPVSLKKLRQVEEAERFLKELGFEECRVRHFGEIAVVAVPRRDFAEVTKRADAVSEYILALGFKFVALDLEGLVSGSLNRLLPLVSTE